MNPGCEVALSALLRTYRRQRMLTQEDLAERAGLSVRTLRGLEAGSQRPRPDTLRRLAGVLDLSDDERGGLASTLQEEQDHFVVPRSGPPSLLPAAVPDFTGREEELVALLELPLDRADSGANDVVAVSGKPGVGKSALVLTAAHRLRREGACPDGQLYVGLRGSRPDPLSPQDALAQLLRALGGNTVSIPDSLGARVDQYRTLTADRQMLLVLDDAADEAQIRPLLPSGPRSRVLITSRGQLAGVEAARLMDLDVFHLAEARTLLRALVGPSRMDSDPAAAEAILAGCGRLPLALRIAGARLAAHPSWSLRRLADRLADEHRRLDELAAGDLEVRASFELSYRSLPEAQRRTFRRLGLLDVPDFAAWAAAEVLDLSIADAEDVLGRLVDAHLVEEAGEDRAGQLRYRFHDLLRVYARERAALEDAAEDRDAAVERALGRWLAIARSLAAGLPWPAAGSAAGSTGLGSGARYAGLPSGPAGPGAGSLAWFEAERAALVAAVGQATDQGRDELACDLAGVLVGFLSSRWCLDDRGHTPDPAPRREAAPQAWPDGCGPTGCCPPAA